MAFLQQPTSMTEPSPPSPPSSKPPHPHQQHSHQPPSIFSLRSLKQATLFFAGATFLTASVLLTKRTITKRHLSIFPKRFTPSNRPPEAANGPFEAIGALNLATLNVSAFGIMLVGGLGWALDISNMEDLKKNVRGGMGVDGTRRNEKDVEEDFEEWIATVLERKAEKEKAKRASGGKEAVERKLINERGRER